MVSFSPWASMASREMQLRETSSEKMDSKASADRAKVVSVSLPKTSPRREMYLRNARRRVSSLRFSRTKECSKRLLESSHSSRISWDSSCRFITKLIAKSRVLVFGRRARLPELELELSNDASPNFEIFSAAMSEFFLSFSLKTFIF